MTKNTKKIKIGKCPFCNGDFLVKDIEVRGKKQKLYFCENYIIERDEEDEGFLLSEKSTCSFRIFDNCLKKYNKTKLSKFEISKIIRDEECVVRLYSKKIFNPEKNKWGNEYFKYAIKDKEFGVSILWDLEVEDTN